MNIVLLGAPGAGKGTQAVLISKKYNLPHISTGQILRENIKANTELGKKAQPLVEKGELVPDELVVDMVKSRLSEDDCKNGFILDGFPRNSKQAEVLDNCLADLNISLNYALNFTCPPDLIVQRLSGRRVCKECGANYHIENMPPKAENICDLCNGQLYQRKDDTIETIKNRLQVYQDTALPLIDYYKQKGIVYDVAADKDPEQIDLVLGQLLKN